MKLRIKANSLRLRLTQGEVAHLAQHGSVVEQMNMAGAVLEYAVHSADVQSITADLDSDSLVVTLPAAMVQSWADSAEVSLQDQHGPLKILVEKDFACLVPRDGEDDADAYPHPGQEAC
ncbi:MAG: hypothetical protein KJO54_09080 [Gammaproteobacteria bacterium]|nr:hypothetical protein [Gammaproteobacteria bacterium]NNF61178.1 hypothetical protein [Gammaproteobacteria bacterium]NNM19873.1 hypothetical protein [Gammaproteobacteria bacterium]